MKVANDVPRFRISFTDALLLGGYLWVASWSHHHQPHTHTETRSPLYAREVRIVHSSSEFAPQMRVSDILYDYHPFD